MREADVDVDTGLKKAQITALFSSRVLYRLDVSVMWCVVCGVWCVCCSWLGEARHFFSVRNSVLSMRLEQQQQQQRHAPSMRPTRLFALEHTGF